MCLSAFARFAVTGLCLFGAVVLTGPHILGPDAHRVVGGTDSTMCPSCVLVTNCYPWCHGAQSTYAFCTGIGAPPTSQCVGKPLAYPCGAGNGCENLHSADGDMCPFFAQEGTGPA